MQPVKMGTQIDRSFRGAEKCFACVIPCDKLVIACKNMHTHALYAHDEIATRKAFSGCLSPCWCALLTSYMLCYVMMYVYVYVCTHV
jgi:hypothetical protein